MSLSRSVAICCAMLAASPVAVRYDLLGHSVLEPVLDRPAATSPAVTVVDTASDVKFLEEIAATMPKMASECIAKNWQMDHPEEREGYKLDDGWWKQGQTLDSARAWWVARPAKYRLWAACESHFVNRLYSALTPAITEKSLPFPAVEHLLKAMLDSTVWTEQQYIASREQGDTAARHIEQTGAAFGDPHRYEKAIIEYYGGAPGFEYDEYRGWAYSLLGRLYFEEGRLDDARSAGLKAKQLLRWEDPMLLTDIDLKQGDTLRALQDLGFCRVAVYSCGNSSSKDTVAQHELHTLYAAVHHGSLAGVDTVMKDALHDPALGFPVQITPWRASDGSTKAHRVAVLQYYTWVHCGNCAAHTTAANALEARFGDNLIVLSYHYEPPLTVPGWPTKLGDLNKILRHMLHVGPENRSAPDTNTFCDWWVGGSCMTRDVFAGFGQFGALALYDQAEPMITKQLAVPSSINLDLRATRDGDRVATNVTVRNVPAGAAAHPLKLQVVLVEDSLMIPGGNSPIQNRLVRSIAGDSTTNWGFPIPSGTTQHVANYRFDIGALENTYHHKATVNGVLEGDASSWSDKVYHIDRNQLSVVAFIQDQTTGEILQAVQQHVPVENVPTIEARASAN